MLAAHVKEPPAIRPCLNIGAPFDVPTGSYIPGKHGEMILNGGLAPVTAVSGRGNTYKSTLAHYMTLTAFHRYQCAELNVYDTEMSMRKERLQKLLSNVDPGAETRPLEAPWFSYTDNTAMMGNAWFEMVRNYLDKEKPKEKKLRGLTEFLAPEGGLFEAWRPTLLEVDSLSQMVTDVVEEMQAKNEVGDSGMNTLDLTGARVKSQLMGQLPVLTASAGAYAVLTAHMGDKIEMGNTPSQKKLSFMKQGVTFKRVPENFTLLTNNCWYCVSATVFQNSDKKVQYPKSPTDDLVGDTDLQLVTLQNLRAKSGPSGIPFELIASQKEGLLIGLSQLNFLKKAGNFGIGGHDRAYFLELYPDVSMQRTTARGKINEDRILRRALELTVEIFQIRYMGDEENRWMAVEPKVLYEDLKAKGYDWGRLLDTRGYWMFQDDIKKDTKPFLSTLDLLRIYHGMYKPYWWDKK